MENRLVLNVSEKINYNPNLYWINQILDRFLCCLPYADGLVFSLYLLHVDDIVTLVQQPNKDYELIISQIVDEQELN